MAAVWAGRAALTLTRLLGRGGTTMPGRVALAIDPGLVRSLSAGTSAGSLLVTGTNGKTTTSSLIGSILQAAGFNCIQNRAGSNLTWGVATALLSAARWPATLYADYALLEVDEGAFPAVVRMVAPRVAVVTNIFRDQLDRYGEVDRVREVIGDGLAALPAGSCRVLNADDPAQAGLVGQNTLTYGLELDLPGCGYENTGRDLKPCPRCGDRLFYDRIYFAHLGHFHCLRCTYRRPAPHVALTGRKPEPGGGSRLQIRLPAAILDLQVRLPGIYNLYNILAAAACAFALEIPPPVIAGALEAAAPSFGRMELFRLEDRKVIMALVKNPVGTNEVIRTMLEETDPFHLLVGINDRIADGTDVSWLWDVDFEQLGGRTGQPGTVAVTGLRAWDMAVRLKYAGFEPGSIKVESNTAAALQAALAGTAPGETLYILPTYTAMLEIRRHLNTLGLGRPYWEEKI